MFVLSVHVVSQLNLFVFPTPPTPPLCRFNMLAKTRQTWKLDGMNSLEYELLSRDHLPLYTNITVNIGTEEGFQPAAKTAAAPGPAKGHTPTSVPAKTDREANVAGTSKSKDTADH